LGICKNHFFSSKLLPNIFYTKPSILTGYSVFLLLFVTPGLKQNQVSVSEKYSGKYSKKQLLFLCINTSIRSSKL